MVITVNTLLKGSLSFMIQLGLKRVALACGHWYQMIPYPVRYGMHSILHLHPDSTRTKTSVGVSVLQSQTMIHITMIPNHEAVISFWGENKRSTYMQLLPTTCLFETKIFVNTLKLPLSPMNEDSYNPSMCTKQE